MVYAPSTFTNEEDRLSNIIIGAAIEAHRALGGPGLLESVYEEALAYELEKRSLDVGRQNEMLIRYKDTFLGAKLRLDLVVNGLVIVECKSVVDYNPIFEAQALTYLRITGLKLALVINFGESTIKKGIHRVVNRL